MSGVADKKKTGSGSDKAQEAEQEVEQEVEQNEGQHDMEISRTEETD